MTRTAARQPVIIVGMHRSGTSLVTRVLDDLGLFVGSRLEANHESLFFLELNSWLLKAAGGRWDNPGPFANLLAHEDGLPLVAEYLERQLSGPASWRYLGTGRYLRARSVFALREPWGWKDPRTTVTLPVWLRLFPGARVVHVVRNGVDVADSLRRRESRAFEASAERFRRHARLAGIVRKKGWFGESPRVSELEGGFSLWEEYLAFARRNLHDTSDRLLEMRYEDFLSDPVENATALAEFCGLDVKRDSVTRAVSRAVPERANSFLGNTELRRFWESVKDNELMKSFGYGHRDEPEKSQR